ncbi:3'(2'), 5'-bisphosphate nucleotidase 1 [Chamberlinius hualienensis]
MSSNFLLELIRASEKAADIARCIRASKELFSLLVQEKDAKEKNQRFIRDFKTLADVLIQETIKFDLTQKFSSLESSSIRGEESNRFTNALGENVVVEVKRTVDETAKLLAKVLDNDVDAANTLAAVVHGNPNSLPFVSNEHIAQSNNIEFSLENFGIWIDPIDSTAEYINGKDEVNSKTICSNGLPCVTVLIGVYDKFTGQPFIGVVNQPFHQFHPASGLWTGRCEWGVNYAEYKLSSFNHESSSQTTRDHAKPRVLISGCEDVATKIALNKKYEVFYAAGAGYKLLSVALGVVDLYILSKATTFRWDLCAPHALLNVFGGGIINYDATVNGSHENFHEMQITYHKQHEDEEEAGKWCNLGGIIAYRNKDVVKQLIELLKQKPA